MSAAWGGETGKEWKAGRRTALIFVVLCGVLGAGLMIWGIAEGFREDRARMQQQQQYHYDSEVAAGEWKVEVQVPPCEEPGKNLQVVWPKEPSGPVTIECNLMPVGTK